MVSRYGFATVRFMVRKTSHLTQISQLRNQLPATTSVVAVIAVVVVVMVAVVSVATTSNITCTSIKESSPLKGCSFFAIFAVRNRKIYTITI